MKNAVSAILIFLASCLCVFGQTPPPPTPAPAPAEAKKATDYKSMVESTLAQDLDTASYYELAAWCRLLGLAEAGDKPALVQRLKEHFKVKPGEEKKEILKRIQINSARSSEYFSLEAAQEDYVLIQGDAVIVLNDKETNTTHNIRAERVLYNQSKNSLTASGNVQYTRKIGDKEEAFTGETFVFDVGNWEGVLYYAHGERKKKMEDKEVLFRYSGKTVMRFKDNSILLEDGVITSSANLKHPHYRITASRVWVYGPGEWAIENAVLYIGDIPSFYIPFYFYSSDELFFNPVVGFKPREGAFWQNTVYLIGKKIREDDALAFLQLEEAGGQDFDMKMEGLYLRPVRKTTPSAATPAPAATSPAAVKHLKFFMDIYSRLGGFAGLSFDASPSIKLFGGIGFSRSIFPTTQFGYTTYYLDEQYWNSGYFFTFKTPFRFGLETDFTYAAGILTRLTGSVKLFSDTYFPTDFYSRNESQDWGKMLGIDLAAQTTAAVTVTTTQQVNLSWKLDAGFNFAPLVKSPLLQTLKIDPFSATFDWSSKDTPVPTTTSVDPDEIARIAKLVNLLAVDPARLFYYPQRLIFPNFTVGVGGTIVAYTSSNAVVPAGPQSGPPTPDASGIPGLLPPFAGGEPAAADKAPLPDHFGLLIPEVKTDVPIDRTIRYFSLTAGYSLNHLFKAEHLFSHENWLAVPDITFYTKNSIFDHSGTSTVNYQMSFLNSTVDVQGNVTLFEKLKTTFTPFSGFDQTPADKSATGLDLTKNLTFSYSPLKPFTDFKDSKLSYTLKWDFFDIYYNTVYRERLLEFTRDTVGTQQVSAYFAFQPEDKTNSLRVSANIPPMLGLLHADLIFYLWIFQTTVTGDYKEQADGTWMFDPVKITEQAVYDKYFSFITNFRYHPETERALDWDGTVSVFNYRYLDRDRYLASQEIKYDFTVAGFTKSLSSIDLWNLKASLLAQRMIPLNPLGVPQGTEPEFVIYKLNLAYGLNLPPIYAWRNRLAFTTNLTTSLNIDFEKIVDSNFTLSLQFSLKIHKFMDIVFTADVYNNNIYRYIPLFVSEVNDALADSGIPVTITPVNPFEDLLKSFNFFNIEDRKNSFFKLKALKLDFIHYLDDWEFRAGFSGEFQFSLNSTTGFQNYTWIPKFNFSLKWLGIPQIKKEISDDGTTAGLQM